MKEEVPTPKILMKGIIIAFMCLILFPFSQVEAMDPMRIPIRMRLPDHIRTIGVAAQYYADIANYRL